MTNPPWPSISNSIERATGRPFDLQHIGPVGGGCINRGHHIRGGSREYFVKLNDAARVAMFEAEADGLAEIAATKTVRVPMPLCFGSNGDYAWIVMEWLPLSADGLSRESAARLGEQLAAMHAVHADRFGWTRDNTIGSTPQSNHQEKSWIDFWREHRLRPQLTLAATKGYRARLQIVGERLLEQLPALFTDHRPRPALLHGDLWGGNAAATVDGAPVIFDPAPYYGDREVDVAMTELFGGFPSSFYSAYRTAAPLPVGYAVRRELYNLYHVLNHLNLFGGAYLGQSEAMIDALLAEMR
jgi:protein-ribulosamine 3-kinase